MEMGTTNAKLNEELTKLKEDFEAEKNIWFHEKEFLNRKVED